MEDDFNALKDEDNLIWDALEKKLLEYNDYFKFLNNIDYLSEAVKDIDDAVKANEYVQTSINLFGMYLDFKKEDKFTDLNKFYSTLYELMKKEILFNNESEIFNIIKDDEIICYNINKYVEEDIESIKTSINEMAFLDKINARVSNISTYNIGSHLVDYELIDLIVKSSYYNEKKEYYKNLVEDINVKVNDNLKKINYVKNKKEYNVQYRQQRLSSLKEELRKNSKDLKKRITALSLSTLLFGGTAFMIPKVSRALSIKKYCETTTEIYVVGQEKQVPLVNYQEKMKKKLLGL